MLLARRVVEREGTLADAIWVRDLVLVVPVPVGERERAPTCGGA